MHNTQYNVDNAEPLQIQCTFNVENKPSKYTIISGELKQRLSYIDDLMEKMKERFTETNIEKNKYKQR
ncbi:hypothetical protein PMAC_001309 [Pneumocystis sp. 'macacae']|nr:hypothetical protein PMAC_001309 [Pneumocystis sp. 'macacae']